MGNDFADFGQKKSRPVLRKPTKKLFWKDYFLK